MQNESCKIYERYENTPSATAQRLYYYPQFAGHFVCNPDFYIEREKWPDILIIHTSSGNGKLFYREKEYILDENNFALINCMDKCTYFPVSEDDWAFSFLHFTGMQATEMYEHIYNLNDGCVFKNNQKIKNNMEDCISLCKKRTKTYEVQISKKLNNILHETLLTIQNDESDKISSVCDYIAENFNKPLSTETLAKISCFSRCYFSTVFKKVTGTTLHDYLLCYRLDRAKEFLIENKMSINQIAENTGFNDVGTFIRAFKKKENTTPLQYKKEHCRK